MTKMKVDYLRVSSAEQKANQTIDSQRLDVAKGAKVRDVEFDRNYEDDGVSGTIPFANRPAGAALMRDAEAGLIGEIFCWKIDRLGRNLRDFLNLCHKLKRLGVGVRPVMQPIPDGPMGEMMLQMLGSFAELERNNIVEATMRGLQQKARSGGFTGGRNCAFGYRVEGIKRTAKLVPDERYRDIVRQLFEKAAAGVTCPALADWLNAQGVPTSWQNPGSLWRDASVQVILKNPTYYGVKRWGKRHIVRTEDDRGNVTTRLMKSPERVIESAVEPIISKELWDRVQVAISKNAIIDKAHAVNDYLLRSLIRCGVCGRAYLGRGKYYSCVGRHSWKRLPGPKCTGQNIHRKELENSIWDLIIAFLLNPGEAIAALEAQMEHEAAQPKAGEDLIRLHARLEKNTAARAKARQQHQDGDSDPAEYAADIKRLSDLRAGIEAEIARLTEISADKVSREAARDSAKTLLEELRDTVNAGFTFAEKRRIVETLVEKVIIEPNGEAVANFRFAHDIKGWLRHLSGIKYPAVKPIGAVPPTAAQVADGAAGLKVAFGDRRHYAAAR
jgi:site-specific DNA recombinase